MVLRMRCIIDGNILILLGLALHSIGLTVFYTAYSTPSLYLLSAVLTYLLIGLFHLIFAHMFESLVPCHF